MHYYKEVLKKYAVFSGRARRAEYWYFVLFNVLVSIGVGIVGRMFGGDGNVLGTIYALVVLIPSLAVLSRRLHDIGKSAWWMLIALIPLIGAIILIVFAVKEGQEGSNQYGSDPKGSESSEVVVEVENISTE
jgi:uncharacterized membrane protein YhaH (DUF805 family)